MKISNGPRFSWSGHQKFSNLFFIFYNNYILPRKKYGLGSKRPCSARPRFLSQNVEYVTFIDRAPHVCFKYAWNVSKTWLQYKNPSNFTNNASISKIFDVLKSLVFALSLRNNVSTLFCVCALQNLTSLKSLLNLLNKCGFFNTFRGWMEIIIELGRQE
mgnify:CR=1 FL=1